jgi:poly-gamma-glutamate synthesis protein (capsule biosynthesis protein)
MAFDTGEFEVAGTGDTIISRPITPYTEDDDQVRAVQDLLQAADVAVTNLEHSIIRRRDCEYATIPRPVSDAYQYPSASRYLPLHAEPEILDELVDFGVNLFSTANNHSFDFGSNGILSTMSALEERNLAYAGMGLDLPDARRPRYLQTSGERVGFVHSTTSYLAGAEAGKPSSFVGGRPGICPLHVEWTYYITEEQHSHLQDVAEATGISSVKHLWLQREAARRETDSNFAFMHMIFEPVENLSDTGIGLSLYSPDREAVLNQVKEADAQADFVVKTIHSHQGPGGSRNVPQTPDFLIEFAHDCIDAGADVLMVTGPHLLRGIEIYEGKPIFYSLGQFFRQYDTMDLKPAESFDLFHVEDDTCPSHLSDPNRSTVSGTTAEGAFPGGTSAASDIDVDRSDRTVVATCSFIGHEVDEIRLKPCVLRDGVPRVVHGEDATRIISELRDLSEPFGTEIRDQGDSGVISSL